MADHTRLLEERVNQAVERLRTLTRERDRLRDEVEELERQLATVRDESTQDAVGHERWQTERRRVLGEIREALVEFRGE